MYWNYVSCCLTVVSTVLVGKRLWHGWILAGLNSVIICLIGFQTRQWGFIPANLFCLVMYVHNIRKWREPAVSVTEAKPVVVKEPVTADASQKAFDGHLPSQQTQRESVVIPVPAYVHTYTDPRLYSARDGVTPVC
ncbi:MAG TPA: hypothetical protein VGN44_17285 [Candidatus Angelobacter sp.]|jgi:hypothetical protein